MGKNCDRLMAGWVLPLILYGLCAGSFYREARADSTWVYAVQISAVVQSSPPQITLSWEPDTYGANSYTVFRKAKDDKSWGAPIAALDGSTAQFTDSNVASGAT